MSSQGTAPGQIKSFEQTLLECWGEWAKTGLGIGMVKPGIYVDDEASFLFSETDILRADRAIAGLPRAYKWALERIFWHKNAGAKEYEIYPAAEEAFRQSLYGNSEDG